jgi:hypothetical protein
VKGPAKEAEEPRPKQLRQIVLEGAMELQRPLQAALDAGARVGPGREGGPNDEVSVTRSPFIVGESARGLSWFIAGPS